MERFFATTHLPAQSILEGWISETALGPVGGPWRSDEVLVFGDQEMGRAAFVKPFELGE